MSATFKIEFGPAILRSRAVVAELGHSTIDAEHVLIGLLSSEDNGAARLLRSMNCPVDRVEQTVRASLPSANQALLSDQRVPFTRRAETVLKNVYLEAAGAPRDAKMEDFVNVNGEFETGDIEIGTKHLLLSLLRNAEDPLVDLLHREFALTHEGILDFLSGSPEGAE